MPSVVDSVLEALEASTSWNEKIPCNAQSDVECDRPATLRVVGRCCEAHQCFGCEEHTIQLLAAWDRPMPGYCTVCRRVWSGVKALPLRGGE